MSSNSNNDGLTPYQEALEHEVNLTEVLRMRSKRLKEQGLYTTQDVPLGTEVNLSQRMQEAYKKHQQMIKNNKE
ncbi:MAG: hypothetical protein UH241_04640 [Acutalibacteraceae bacterium]|nr:hypothetical protein [Acutalibacteraceae bacterium]